MLKKVILGLIILLSTLTSTSDASALSWSYQNSSLQTNPISGILNGNAPCSSQRLQTMRVYGLSEQSLFCLHGDDKITLGVGYGYGPAAIKFKSDSFAYRLLGVNNNNWQENTLYVPSRDILITKYPTTTDVSFRYLVIYHNFSQRLQLSYHDGALSYQFDDSNPDYTFKVTSTDGLSEYKWPVGAISISGNGRWLGFELIERGIGLLDLNSLDLKWINSDKYPMYGHGSNPTMEIAVSNDGEHVIAIGVNSDLRIIDVSETCGETPSYDKLVSGQSILQPCPISDGTVHSNIPNFHYGIKPTFSDNGAELHFYGTSYTAGAFSAYIQSSGYTSPRLDYLALGDSYSSGEGATNDDYYISGTNVENNKCHVSTLSYPFLLTESQYFTPNLVKNVACSGATTKDIIGDDNENYGGQSGRMFGVIPSSQFGLAYSGAQLSFTPGISHQENFVRMYKPKVVTVGVGGNDIDLVGKLIGCMVGNCDIMSDPVKRAETAQEIQSSFYSLKDTFSELASLSPESKIYAIGYPKVINLNPTCNGVTGLLLNTPKRQFADESISYLNQVVEAATRAAGVAYIDIENAFGDYALCGFEPSAMNPFRFGDDGPTDVIKFIGNESFHPNEIGHSDIAAIINGSVSNLASHNYCEDGTNTCPDTSVTPPSPSNYWNIAAANESSIKRAGSFVFDLLNSVNNAVKLIQTGDYNFSPNSIVRIEITSSPVDLGTFLTDSNGNLTTEINLPDNLEEGFHTIHLYGSSYSGESIELYQTIKYETPEPITPEPSDDIPPEDPGQETPPENTDNNQEAVISTPTEETIPQEIDQNKSSFIDDLMASFSNPLPNSTVRNVATPINIEGVQKEQTKNPKVTLSSATPSSAKNNTTQKDEIFQKTIFIEVTVFFITLVVFSLLLSRIPD